MSYTNKLIETGFSNLIPYGNSVIEKSKKLFGIESQSQGQNSSGHKTSRNQEKARLATARALEKAVNQGRLDPSFHKKVKKMKKKAKNRLALSDFNSREKKIKILGETTKIAPLLDLVACGSGSFLTDAGQITAIINATKLASTTSNGQDAVIKTMEAIAPLMVKATSNIWQPYATLPFITIGAIGILGTTLLLDSMNYFKKHK